MQTLSELLKNTADRYPDKTFIVYEDQRITYKEFDEKTSQFANALRNLGVKKGDVVGLYLPSCPELAIGYYACQKLGAIANPMSAMFKGREVDNVVSRTSMPVIVTSMDNYSVVQEVQSRVDTLKEIIVSGAPENSGLLSMEQLIQQSSKEIELVKCEIDDVAVLFFTSGTTGLPKGAMQTHKSIYSTIRDMEVFWKFKHGKEVILGVLPIFNNFGATVNMNAAIFNGGTMVLIKRWDTEKVLEAITAEKATFFAGTPTMFLYLIQKFNAAKYDVSSLNLLITGGSIVPPEIIEKVEKELNVKVVQIYGATETSGANTAEPLVGIRKKGSAGVPIGSITIKIVSEEGEELPAGEIGEVVIKGDPVGIGYWKDIETTKKAFKEDGWYSGDLGYVDEDGYLYIVDRKKDIIICGGNNIFPIEVEDVLYSLPEVGVAAVVGIPDEAKGEIPKAFLVLNEGAKITEEEVIAYCRKNLSVYKVPRMVEFISEMPMNLNGKILKRELRNWHTSKQPN
jgi:long-chain acyl-CoA synthetase